MPAFDLDAWVARADALDLAAIAWTDVGKHEVSPAVVQALTEEGRGRTSGARGSAGGIICSTNRVTSSSTTARPRSGCTVAVRPGSRALVDRFWAPVGSGVGPQPDLKFMARYLFAGAEGRAAARKVDDTIRKLAGFERAQLLEAWMDRHVRPVTGLNGGRNGYALN